MSDYSALKTAAKAAIAECEESGQRWPEGDDWFDPELINAEMDFVKAASPATVLTLVSENERLESCYRGFEKTLSRVHCMWAKRMLDATGKTQQVLLPDEEFVELFEEIKQLKAENSALRAQLT